MSTPALKLELQVLSAILTLLRDLPNRLISARRWLILLVPL